MKKSITASLIALTVIALGCRKEVESKMVMPKDKGVMTINNTLLKPPRYTGGTGTADSTRKTGN